MRGLHNQVNSFRLGMWNYKLVMSHRNCAWGLAWFGRIFPGSLQQNLGLIRLFWLCQVCSSIFNKVEVCRWRLDYSAPKHIGCYGDGWSGLDGEQLEHYRRASVQGPALSIRQRSPCSGYYSHNIGLYWNYGCQIVHHKSFEAGLRLDCSSQNFTCQFPPMWHQL